MGKLIKLFIFFLITHHSLSQDILWEKSYGGKHGDFLFDAQPTADYGFILAGSSLSGKTGNKEQPNHGDLDYWIWKMNEKGEIDWQKNIGGSGIDVLQSVKITNDGGFILAGTSDSPKEFDKKSDCRGQADFWVIKLNAAGDEEWQKTIGGNAQEQLLSISTTRDGGYIIGGSSESDISNEKSVKSYGGMDFWIIKLTNLGEISWQKAFGGEHFDILRSIEQTKDGGYIMGGYSNSAPSGNKTAKHYGNGDYWVIKTDSKGEEEWQRSYGGDGDDQLFALHQTIDKNYIIGGSSSSGNSSSKSKSNQKGTDFWVMKIDENGNSVWQETYNFGKVDMLTSLVENEDQSFLIGGYAQSEVFNTTKSDKKEINDYIALKVDSKGQELWNKTVGSAGEDILKKLLSTRDGGYLLSGTSNSKVSRDKNSSKGNSDFWVVKLKDREKLEKTKTYVEAIPNPAKGFTNIIVGYEFESGTATVVDLAGHTLQEFEIKTNTIPIDFSSYPEGIYIVNIKTNLRTNGVKVIKSNN